jgi:hypothetical protein
MKARLVLGKNKVRQSYARFEVLTAVIMKNAVFWNIKSQSIPDTASVI